MTASIPNERAAEIEGKKKKSKKTEDATAVSVDSKQHKKDKKDKKRKREEVEQEQEEEQVQVEEKDQDSEKKKKKKKKKRSEDTDAKPADADVEMEAPEELETSKVEKEKRKEKKEKKEKKDKKKKEKVLAEATQESETVAGPSKGALPVPSREESADFLKKNNIAIHVPKGEPEITPILAFNQLNIPEGLRHFSAKFKEPSPIQACAWPAALRGKDVVGIAETGSGKTLAFGIPALSQLIATPAPSGRGTSTVSVLVVAPTRELALQTHDAMTALGEPLGIASVAVFGGVPKDPQVKMLKNLNKNGLTTRIIVGTPGRILDLMSEGVCDLSGVNYLVLDEADRMLDKGFENDIRKIIAATKPAKERQTLMFSATWPEAVRRLANTFQNNPVRVTVGSDDLTANSRVEQLVEVLDDSRQKDSRLLYHLRNFGHQKRPQGKGSEESRIIVFALYKAETSRVEQMLTREGYATSALHGDINQAQRLKALEDFKNGVSSILVATDVAARGLDIPNVKAVINYTFPLIIDDYIHRIGRTGRGGKHGKSVTFFTGENQERGLAGELSRVLKDGGFDCPGLQKFPMTIKKKEHSLYGAFYRDDIPTTTRKKITF